jgi:hypothetical protein
MKTSGLIKPITGIIKKGQDFIPKIKAISFKRLTDRELAGMRFARSFAQSAV